MDILILPELAWPRRGERVFRALSRLGASEQKNHDERGFHGDRVRECV